MSDPRKIRNAISMVKKYGKIITVSLDFNKEAPCLIEQLEQQGLAIDNKNVLTVTKAMFEACRMVYAVKIMHNSETLRMNIRHIYALIADSARVVDDEKANITNLN